MTSALSSPFQMDGIAEVVPDYAKVAGKLTQSSVITGRRRVRLVPQSGQNYSSGNSAGVVNILIQDGQAYADLLSATLSFTLLTWDSAGTPGSNTTILDDGAYSVFRRALVSVNSTLMDDTDFLAKKVNAEIVATASQDWYNSVGSWLGLWKHSTSVYGQTPASAGVDTFVSKYNVADKFPLWKAVTQDSTTNTGTGAPAIPGQNKFAVPLSLLTSFFRNDTLFPSRNAGQLYVQLNIASALEAMYKAGSTGAAAVPNFSISNLTLELDFVDLHPTYLSMMDDIIEAPGGNGVQWAFDAHMTATQALGSGAGQQSIIVSKASQNMRSLQVIVQPQSALSSGTWLPQSTFSNPGLVDIQYRIGSLYYPAFTAVGENRCFFDLQNAFGSPESVDKCGLIDTINYYQHTSAAGVVSANNSGTSVANSTGRNNYNNYAWCDLWTYAYCFDRLKHAKFHGIDLDGVNTLTSAGSQMVVQLNANLPEASQMTAFVRFTRVLKLAGGSTQVVG
jgi:hypothetical protein